MRVRSATIYNFCHSTLEVIACCQVMSIVYSFTFAMQGLHPFFEEALIRLRVRYEVEKATAHNGEEPFATHEVMHMFSLP
jgi:hypothetical protein